MADYSTGLFDIDVNTKKVAHLAPLAGATLLGIDGLYFHKGSLIGVQNGVAPQRVVRVSLSKDLAGLNDSRYRGKQPGLSRTHAWSVGERHLFLHRNSQWPLVDENGKLAAEDKLQDPVVLKIKLEAR